MINRRMSVVLAGTVLLVLSVLYCLPSHPSTHRGALDMAAHVLLFAGMGVFGWAALRSHGLFAALALLGALLEVVQWWFGGYPHIERADILGNELGVLLAWLLCRTWSRRRPL